MVVSPTNLSVFEAVQSQLDARLAPCWVDAEALTHARRILLNWVARDAQGAIIAAVLSGDEDWPASAPLYEAIAETVVGVYIFSPAPITSEISNLYFCQFPKNSKLAHETLIAIFSPKLSCTLVGRHPDPSSFEEAAQHCATYFSYEAPVLSSTLAILRQVLDSQLRDSSASQKSILFARTADIIPEKPDAKAASAVMQPLLQLLDTGNHYKSQLQRQAQRIENLQQLIVDLQQAIAFKEEFMEAASQQLCTPLTNMKTAVKLLRSPHLKEEQQERYWSVLLAECDQQVKLINSLVELSKLEPNLVESQPPLPVALFNVVPGLVSMYQAVAQENGVMLAYTIPSSLPKVSFPAASVKQVFLKLIENSIQCTKEGDKIWVIASTNGSFVQVEVRDTGVGIPEELLPRIFERFYRVPRPQANGGGVGLGLTIVRKSLQLYGGSISVSSEVGRGTIFTVLLPTLKATH